MQLNFALPEPRSLERIRALFEAMASTLVGRTVTLSRGDHHEEPDLNGERRCFVATWRDGPVTFEERVLNGSGDPRERWGYLFELKLTLPSFPVQAQGPAEVRGERLVVSSILPEFTSSGRDWLALRETLRAQLGVENDRCSAPFIVADVLGPLVAEGDLITALALARESLASARPQEISREKVVEWLAANDPSSGGPAMRVREAPAMLEGWLELERAGDATLTEVFARLCPFDLARWKAAGLPAAPWFAHPAWPFERVGEAEANWRTIDLTAEHVSQGFASSMSAALTGWSPYLDWQQLGGESLPGVDGWRWFVTRLARYPEGGRWPVVHVSLEGVRREPHEWSLPWSKLESKPLREKLRWTWIGGVETGDALVLVERALPRGRTRTLSQAGVALTVVGSSDFRARTEAAVTRVSQLRWHPVTASRSLEPSKHWKRGVPGFPSARVALRKVLARVHWARAEALLECRCAHLCEHRLELLHRSREEEHSVSPSGQARSAAWSAALATVGARPDPEAARRNLRSAQASWLLAKEYVDAPTAQAKVPEPEPLAVDVLLAQAQALPGVNFRSLASRSPEGVRSLQLMSLRDEEDPSPLLRFVELEALSIMVMPLSQEALGVIARLPRLRALTVFSTQSALIPWVGGFPALELLELPSLEDPLDALRPCLESLSCLRKLWLPNAKLRTLPAWLTSLANLRELELSGAPVSTEELTQLARARRNLRVRTSPINLGWEPGCPGVLRVADGFPVDDLPPSTGWETGLEVSILNRQVTVTVRWRENAAETPDYHEAVHGPFEVETFVRQGPPTPLGPYDRASLRRHLEAKVRGS